MDFYHQLKEMCEKLKSYPRKPTKTNPLCRQALLPNYMYTFNQLIATQRQDYTLLNKRYISI